MKVLLIVIIILMSQTESIRKHKRKNVEEVDPIDVESIILDVNSINHFIEPMNECHNNGHSKGKFGIKLKCYYHDDDIDNNKIYQWTFRILYLEWNNIADEINKNPTVQEYAEKNYLNYSKFIDFKSVFNALYNMSHEDDQELKEKGIEDLKSFFEKHDVKLAGLSIYPETKGLKLNKITKPLWKPSL